MSFTKSKFKARSSEGIPRLKAMKTYIIDIESIVIIIIVIILNILNLIKNSLKKKITMPNTASKTKPVLDPVMINALIVIKNIAARRILLGLA
jgi:hypothetical protein